MNTTEFSRIIYSPQWVSRLLHYFLSGAQEVSPSGIRIELIYLILPMITDSNIVNALNSCTTRSSYNTFIDKHENYDIQESISKIPNRLFEFKEKTNIALIYLYNTQRVSIGENLVIDHTISYQKEKEPLRTEFKAAFNLGVILAKENCYIIFNRLGIKEL